LKVLFIGDIIGRPGRQAVEKHLAKLKAEYGIDYVIANAENAAGGFGITTEVATSLFMAGCDALTLGNHLYDQVDAEYLLEANALVARPANMPPGNPGRPWIIVDGAAGPLAIINLMGRVFMNPIDCPFRVCDAVLEEIKDRTKCVFVDFHAEATSEKQALGIYLDGRVSAVVGTHTHVMTADERVLPGGTGFLTDVGMTGPHYSVIGMKHDGPLTKFLTQKRKRFDVATDDVRLCAVVVDIDSDSGKCRSIQRIMLAQ
jgi:metallophosphoesterase (TIGR00282 family)